jgi:hypothetical protein
MRYRLPVYANPSLSSNMASRIILSISYNNRNSGLQSIKLRPWLHLLVLEPSVSFPSDDSCSSSISSSLELSNSVWYALILRLYLSCLFLGLPLPGFFFEGLRGLGFLPCVCTQMVCASTITYGWYTSSKCDL